MFGLNKKSTDMSFDTWSYRYRKDLANLYETFFVRTHCDVSYNVFIRFAYRFSDKDYRLSNYLDSSDDEYDDYYYYNHQSYYSNNNNQNNIHKTEEIEEIEETEEEKREREEKEKEEYINKRYLELLKEEKEKEKKKENFQTQKKGRRRKKKSKQNLENKVEKEIVEI